jgi:hypothetical protein
MRYGFAREIGTGKEKNRLPSLCSDIRTGGGSAERNVGLYLLCQELVFEDAIDLVCAFTTAV